MVEVARLIDPAMMIEIEVDAEITDRATAAAGEPTAGRLA